MNRKIKLFAAFVKEDRQMVGDDIENIRNMMPLRRKKRPENPAARLAKLMRVGYELTFAISPRVSAEIQHYTDVLHTGIYTVVKSVDARGKRVLSDSLYQGVDLTRVYASEQDAQDSITFMEDEPVYVFKSPEAGAAYGMDDDPHDGAYFNDGSQYVVSEVIAYNED